MKFKQFLIILSLLVMVNTANANKLLYGMALINQQITQDINIASSASTITLKESSTGLGIYADYYFKGNYRFNGTISYIDYDDFNITSLTAAADYLIPVNPKFTLFAGITSGGAAMKFSNASLSNTSIGSLYGAQLGGIAFLSNGVMLELGYRMRMSNIETELLNPGGPSDISTVDELDETYLNLILSF